MVLLSLKAIAYKKLEAPGFVRTIKDFGKCPYSLAEPLLKQMSVQQLLAIEEKSPQLRLSTYPVWKLHTLKAFPTIVDTHEIDAEDVDWREVYHDMLEERKEREQAAREKLKANYNQIAQGKSARSVQVTQKAPPTRQQVRNMASRTSLGMPSHGGTSIMNKAVRASLNSITRSAPRRDIPVQQAFIRPNPNTKVQCLTRNPAVPRAAENGLQQTNTKPRPSKLLLPSKRKPLQ